LKGAVDAPKETGMKNRRILIWIVIVAVVAGGAIAFLGYRLYIAEQKYVSTDGGFSLRLPLNCESPEISHTEAGRSLWLSFCKDGAKVLVFRQPWEEFRKEAMVEATKQSGAHTAGPVAHIPLDELVEATVANLTLEKYFASGVPCATGATGTGNFGTHEFTTPTQKFTMTKIVVDGQYNAYCTTPIEWKCNPGLGGYGVDTAQHYIMVLFAGSNLYKIVLQQPFTANPDRWNKIVQSFHVL
jgi:hypothetical protein